MPRIENTGALLPPVRPPLMLRLGVKSESSIRSSTPLDWRFSPDSATTDIGVSCNAISRRSAVTTISSSAGVSSAAKVAVEAATLPIARSSAPVRPAGRAEAIVETVFMTPPSYWASLWAGHDSVSPVAVAEVLGSGSLVHALFKAGVGRVPQPLGAAVPLPRSRTGNVHPRLLLSSRPMRLRQVDL